MPIYVHECSEHGRQDFFSRAIDPRPWRPCQECGEPAGIVVTAHARHDIERDWNEKASDWQGHGAYHQAKAQLRNMDREQQERQGRPPMKITEEAIQATAKAIDDQKRAPRAAPEVRQAKAQRKASAKMKKAIQ